MSAKSPLDFFFLFFSYEMFKNIADQTNLYQVQLTNLKPSPMIWMATTAEEIMAFIGVNIAMGIANLPEMDDYWSKGSICHGLLVFLEESISNNFCVISIL